MRASDLPDSVASEYRKVTAPSLRSAVRLDGIEDRILAEFEPMADFPERLTYAD